MVSFLIRLGFFILVSIIGYIILVIGWGEISPKRLQNNLDYKINAYGHLNSRLKEAKEFKDVDILFLGSSRAYRHYDPRVFEKKGYTSFNLGSSSQTFIQTEVLLKRYLSELNPKIIVLDVYPGMFSSDGVESSLDLISNEKADKYSLKMMLIQKNIKVLNTFIFSWYRSLFYNMEAEKGLKGEDTYISGGFVEKTVNPAKINAIDTMDFNIRSYQLDALLNIISQIRAEKRKLIVVQSPRQHGKIYKSENRLDSLFNSHNINYLNYSNLSMLDDSAHFYNPMHLNQNGVEIYNNIFINQVLKYDDF